MQSTDGGAGEYLVSIREILDIIFSFLLGPQIDLNSIDFLSIIKINKQFRDVALSMHGGDLVIYHGFRLKELFFSNITPLFNIKKLEFIVGEGYAMEEISESLSLINSSRNLYEQFPNLIQIKITQITNWNSSFEHDDGEVPCYLQPLAPFPNNNEFEVWLSNPMHPPKSLYNLQNLSISSSLISISFKNIPISSISMHAFYMFQTLFLSNGCDNLLKLSFFQDSSAGHESLSSLENNGRVIRLFNRTRLEEGEDITLTIPSSVRFFNGHGIQYISASENVESISHFAQEGGLRCVSCRGVRCIECSLKEDSFTSSCSYCEMPLCVDCLSFADFKNSESNAQCHFRADNVDKCYSCGNVSCSYDCSEDWIHCSEQGCEITICEPCSISEIESGFIFNCFQCLQAFIKSEACNDNDNKCYMCKGIFCFQCRAVGIYHGEPCCNECVTSNRHSSILSFDRKDWNQELEDEYSRYCEENDIEERNNREVEDDYYSQDEYSDGEDFTLEDATEKININEYANVSMLLGEREVSKVTKRRGRGGHLQRKHIR